MAQHRANRWQGGPLAQHLRSGRMAQDMGPIDGAFDLGTMQGAGGNL